MMSLSTFRKNLFQAFSLMRDTHTSFEIYHRRKVYKIHVEDTGRKVTTPYQRHKAPGVSPELLITTKACPKCDSMLVNGLCLNRSCQSNQKAAV